LLDAIGKGAKANLLPGGAIKVSSTYGTSKAVSAVDGIYPWDVAVGLSDLSLAWFSNPE